MASQQEIFQEVLKMVSFETHELGIDLSDGDNISALTEQAERSGVASWIFYRLLQKSENVLKYPELMASLKRRYLAILFDNQQKLGLYRHIEKILVAHDIPSALLKGMAMAFTVYPEEALRPMGDLDILVPEHLVIKARDILLDSGAQSVHIPMSEWHERNNAHVRAMRLPPYKHMVEVHSKLYATGSRLLPKKMLWEDSVVMRTTSFGKFPVLKEPLMLYHLASHLSYGYSMGGIRLGWLVDIAMLLDAAEDINDLMGELLKINPSYNNELLRAVGWAVPFLHADKRRQLEPWQKSFVNFPANSDFLEEQDAEPRHRQIVLENLWHTPGLINKVKGTWFQIFPSPEYMAHYHGLKRKIMLPAAYLKRLMGRG